MKILFESMEKTRRKKKFEREKKIQVKEKQKVRTKLLTNRRQRFEIVHTHTRVCGLDRAYGRQAGRQ